MYLIRKEVKLYLFAGDIVIYIYTYMYIDIYDYIYNPKESTTTKSIKTNKQAQPGYGIHNPYSKLSGISEEWPRW